ncbi:MAG: nucleotidyltransferase domain-containing protein [Roseofilum sp. SID3]|uniref:nucleotidyltransferase domain-containing protein n=1 Tax=Roseofilum sp. SID3 TaxID=2821499 RepID=UPI001B2DFDAA|nr:nucleotidyltransferase domain-containing protein [Roseofilum sp. SID3]MBP0015322.1 nucleotidyltransferase domain-containing protein [Roseofilum sp. SID3]
MRHPKLLEILDAIAFAVGGTEVIIYGSQVRGDATEQSDIDLMCFDTKLYHGLLPLIAALEEQHQVPITLQWGNRSHYLKSKTAFWRSLRSQAVTIQDFLISQYTN